MPKHATRFQNLILQIFLSWKNLWIDNIAYDIFVLFLVWPFGEDS